ncbi:hypothetical protein N7537_010386 [Penicillium hordei]|uniref:Carrier domain-containing protein n=1 Tax=Penicillium hordei TaxID=40994 RepID=A0AAD6DUQ8_9EURO|nr:uncharacterized protein N7537_010386 [Penicillium hordei]KAJ5593482.1 hypothetical protein N7537_010386 [Penicillium hordei]
MGIQRSDQTVHAASIDTANPLVQEFGQLQVLDDLIRLRAADIVQHPILAYPRSASHAASYDYYSGQDLNGMINQAATMLMDFGFQTPRQSKSIVALLSVSDLDMVVTFFALSRLGYIVMMLSPRLSGKACVTLLEAVGCETIVYGETATIRATMGDILQRKLVSCRPLPRASLDTQAEPRFFFLCRDRNPDKTAVILHSSGSTGAPNPLFLTHRALMTHPLKGPRLTSFNPLPWYHLHGLSTAFQAMWMRKTAYMWNAALPMTAELVLTALEEVRPELLAAVPYMLQLLVDDPRGIAALQKCTLVTYGGAPCPDELGDRLVREGVKFGASFGLTEAGLVADSISRHDDDPCWNYLQFFDSVRPYVWMKPISKAESLYECVYLAGHPALTTSNSDDPPGSFHSKDVFVPHPTIRGRWKFLSRLDDRVTLANGEKVLPLSIEGHVKQHPLVDEAVVVGVGKATPGLLVLRSEKAGSYSLPDEDYLDAIWPSIEEANSHAEAFAQISRDMVAILPYTAKLPRTDKGSMVRAQVYQQYAELIETLYTPAARPDGGLQLGLAETQSHLLQLCWDDLGVSISGVDADLFSEGVDSLKAIYLRRLIRQQFRFDPCHSLSQNLVFEMGTISQLAQYICALQSGGRISTAQDSVSLMKNLVKKYSLFRKHLRWPETPRRTRSVLLTGATGSVGAHVLFELLNDDSVSTVYCLTRKPSPLKAIRRSLLERGLLRSPEQTSKVVALNGSLNRPDFCLDPVGEIFRHMLDSVSLIIHTAWPVNFNLPLARFEPHIRGLYNLIEFSLSVRKLEPAVLMFCSSISTALRGSSAMIQEEPLELDSALMGYGQSKLVGEKMISLARQAGARAYSLRIGQVSGHSMKGLWNDSEAIPLIIRSALTLRALPDLHQDCSWLLVDKLASVVLELAESCSAPDRDIGPNRASGPSGVAYVDDSIYNVYNPRVFPWSELLATLKRSGFQFQTLPFVDWLQLLRESEARGEENVNPAVKLIDHFEEMYGDESLTRQKWTREFATAKAERDSVTLRNGLSIVENRILDRYTRDWLMRWTNLWSGYRE